MSADTVDSDDETAVETITLTRMEEGDGWVARDEDSGVASQGETRTEALEMLDEAVALHKGEVGEGIESPEAERQLLEELGIDSDEIESARETADDVPEFVE
ncbi:type II toxin-antitoxin system HicB family antitoxin [Halolamina sp. C58]|uniref:type II toxin-antitoxin system HicB family antitoxin n=1 Tax=Halolamina sp. C58 TaxID=3421640 RepID=UPI003EBCAE1A